MDIGVRELIKIEVEHSREWRREVLDEIKDIRRILREVERGQGEAQLKKDRLGHEFARTEDEDSILTERGPQ